MSGADGEAPTTVLVLTASGREADEIVDAVNCLVDEGGVAPYSA